MNKTNKPSVQQIAALIITAAVILLLRLDAPMGDPASQKTLALPHGYLVYLLPLIAFGLFGAALYLFSLKGVCRFRLR